jgi:putative transposase
MEDVLATRSEYRLQQWADMTRACRESGMSNKEFCRQNGISEKTYYYWLRRLREAACENAQPKLVRLEAAKEQESEHCAILLRYKDAELEIRAGTDCDTITMVLQALKSI